MRTQNHSKRDEMTHALRDLLLCDLGLKSCLQLAVVVAYSPEHSCPMHFLPTIHGHLAMFTDVEPCP